MLDSSYEIINEITFTFVGLIGSTLVARSRAKDHHRQSIDSFLQSEWSVYCPNNLEVGKSRKSSDGAGNRITDVSYNGKRYNIISEKVPDHWLTDFFESTRFYQAVELKDI